MNAAPLKPRAVAVLCCLRASPRSRLPISHAIGDSSTHDTQALLVDMRLHGLVGRLESDDRWYLDEAGIEWLEAHGLTVDPSARLRGQHPVAPSPNPAEDHQ